MKLVKEVSEAAALFREGKIGVFPTDTVYGVGCIATREESIKRLYSLKKRDQTKPTHLLISSLSQVERYADTSHPAFQKLAEKFWPGPLTIILKARDTAPELVCGKENGVKTIGLRMPNHQLLLKIIEEVGEPVLGPSANFAGNEPPKTLLKVDKEFLKLVDFCVDEKCGGELPSTIVDLTLTPHRIIRMGTINSEQINKALNN